MSKEEMIKRVQKLFKEGKIMMPSPRDLKDVNDLTLGELVRAIDELDPSPRMKQRKVLKMGVRKVWKYPLEVRDGHQDIEIPIGGRIIHVDNQNEVPTLWVEVEPKYASMITRTFRVFGTGHEIEAGWKHRGTCIISPFVWHVYEWSFP